MKAFLITCTVLMCAAGIYGATDMTRDLSNGRLIDYEHANSRHAKNLLAIVKTLGIGIDNYEGENPELITAIKVHSKHSLSEDTGEISEYFTEFSRGDE